MAKSRRVKAKGKGGPKAPAIHKFAGKKRPEPKSESRAEAKPEPRAAVHKFTGRKEDEGRGEAKGEGRGEAKGEGREGRPANARLAAMAAASAEVADEPEIQAKPAKGAPKGGVDWKDLEDDEDGPGAGRGASAKGKGAKGEHGKADSDDEAVMVAPPPPPPAAAGDGIQVVAKGASKFSAADLELLRASIKVKGTGAVVEGVNLDELKWDAEGLLPVVAQDRRTGAVLNLGHVNRETLESTLRGKTMTYWDRNHGKAVARNAESGRAQRLVRLAVDCDKDAILAVVDQEGPACHKDTGTCWGTERAIPPAGFLGELDRIVKDRAKDPKPGSKTSKLLAEPIEALRAFVEEANSLTKAVQGKSKESLEAEAADLLYHLLVTLRTKGVGLDQVLTELQAQHLAMEMKKGG